MTVSQSMVTIPQSQVHLQLKVSFESMVKTEEFIGTNEALFTFDRVERIIDI